MKKNSLGLLFVAAMLSTTAHAFAQDRIYRCGNEYTNNAVQAQERGCKVVEGGNITIVQAGPARSSPAPSASVAATTPSSSSARPAAAPPNAPRVSTNDQRARDADARAILDAELKKAETRLANLQRDYNNGEPERNALELRNPALYQERVSALKDQVARAESDIGGIRREIERRTSSP